VLTIRMCSGSNQAGRCKDTADPACILAESHGSTPPAYGAGIRGGQHEETGSSTRAGILRTLAGYYDVSMFRDAKRSFLTHTCDEPNGLLGREGLLCRSCNRLP